MKTLVIVQGVPLVELFLTELTCVLFHPIVHIHVVLKKLQLNFFLNMVLSLSYLKTGHPVETFPTLLTYKRFD